MSEFSRQNIKGFLEDLASDMPAPGGGAAAGLIAALSGALNSMVYSLTVDKKPYLSLNDEEQKLIKNFQSQSKKFIDRGLVLMEMDKKNFMKLMDSFKLPRETNEEKAFRNHSIKENTIKAMEAPLLLARESLKFYDNLNVMAKYGNKGLLSDLSISAILLHSAIESSIVNVKVNLNGLRNEEFFHEIDLELKKIFHESLKQKEKIVRDINEIIYPE